MSSGVENVITCMYFFACFNSLALNIIDGFFWHIFFWVSCFVVTLLAVFDQCLYTKKNNELEKSMGNGTSFIFAFALIWPWHTWFVVKDRKMFALWLLKTLEIRVWKDTYGFHWREPTAKRKPRFETKPTISYHCSKWFKRSNFCSFLKNMFCRNWHYKKLHNFVTYFSIIAHYQPETVSSIHPFFPF